MHLIRTFSMVLRKGFYIFALKVRPKGLSIACCLVVKENTLLNTSEKNLNPKQLFCCLLIAFTISSGLNMPGSNSGRSL